MKKYETPQPINVEVELGVGSVQVVASVRTDTVVEVLPSKATARADVAAAEQTRVEFSGGRLSVKTPKSWRRFTPFGDSGSVAVTIEVPEGSTLSGESGMATLRATGRLGDCRFKSGYGDLDLDDVETLDVHTAYGDVSVATTAGATDITTASGALRLGTIGGPANLKNGNGESQILDAKGEVRVKAGNGNIVIDRAAADVSAKTAYGNVRLNEVVRGSVSATSAFGDIDIGIGGGSAAWLDLVAHHGRVETTLANAEVPRAGEPTVEVVARTTAGVITVYRSDAR